MDRHVIARLGHLGDGIAPGPVFVPRSLPGEVVEGAVHGDRMPSPRILTPSPERIAAPCPHYAACGGCSLLHASDGFVARWKADMVRSALAAHDLAAPIRAIATSPPNSRRRAVISVRRTRSGALAGFHARASDTLTPIPECRILVPAILGRLGTCEALALAGASRKAELSIHVTHGPAGLDLAVDGGKPLDADLMARLAALAAEADLARLTWGDETVVRTRVPWLPMGPARVAPPPRAFLQATAHGEAALVARVLAATRGAAKVVDLFAGCGTFSLPLSRRAEVHAVEGLAAPLASALAGWRGASGLKPLTAETRDLFRRPLLAAELDRFEAGIVDPPRAGAEAQMHQIAASGLSRVAAISCNPVSFARDAAILCAAGFRIDRIDVVDQFRWSPHVELVAEMTR